jgi:hypothetical protein
MSGAPAKAIETTLNVEELDLVDRALAQCASHLDSRAQNTTGRNCNVHRETAARMRTLRARLGREKAKLSRDGERLWEHPAVEGKHIVSMTRHYPKEENGEPYSVATCACGWTFRWKVKERGADRRSDAVDDHWREVIAKAEAEAA